ncbi:glycoside hydrolase family 3 C-terminal domain-containing protein [Actinomyces sp. 186855]|nr:glycoside hydrolase family 3 C-terminal domain-containing protein [Actinomyces sp. AC-20-1]MCL3789755.1 glycoside hydrolase family 3 C-terminal domain-containing protein [Actinomyces sp. 187325]MCL3793137.1 glycoside hydrolase family 3 C-terminal domain-containing protein [Actinomyces sp. 186855]MCL3795546.1 glycoside hydrolase family 3 C-terminal domain-containing protein [Actinomyces sp. 217892]
MDTRLTPQERAAALLAGMSTAEKMAQLQCVMTRTSDDVHSDALGALMPLGTGHVSTLSLRQVTDMAEAIAYQRDLQKRVMALQPHRVPAVFHMEALCGAYLPGATSFPNAIGRGASFDPGLEEEIGRVVASQERALGITYSLAPVLDVTRDPRMGRYGESYGEDPTLGGALGAALIRGLQSEDGAGRRTDAVAKHFLGFHASEGGIHGAHAPVTDRLLGEVYAKPFQAAINAGLKGVMPCYNAVNGEVVSGSRRLLTGLLREQMGFEGTVVADYGAIGNMHAYQRAAESLTDAGHQALAAGLDVEWPVPQCYNDELVERFESGEADTALLDRAVTRVLTAKFRMGLFEDPFAWDGTRLAAAFEGEARRAARAVTLRSARESLVLLTNDGTLPIPTGPDAPRRVLVVGPQAIQPRFHFAGYSHQSMAEGLLAARSSMAGTIDVQAAAAGEQATYPTIPGTPVQSDDAPEFDAVLAAFHPGARSVLDELRERLPRSEVRWVRGYEVAGASEEHWAEALREARRADLVVLMLGGKNGTASIATMGEGVDATGIGLPHTQEGLLRQVVELGVPAVGVHMDGRPVSSDAADRLGALVEAWNPAEAGGQAVAELLVGEISPSGRLPVSVARSAGQVPVYHNHPHGSQWHQAGSVGFPEYVDMPHTPRYPFGHGLGYTSFEYGALELSAAEVAPDGALTARVTVTNTGARAGTEVVQLYGSDRYASTVRPVQELLGFQRVELEPGQSSQVAFTVTPDLLALLDGDMRWVVEAGDIDLRVGSSSADVRAEAFFRVSATAAVDPRRRALWAPSVWQR